ncbi:MAG: hypothetical protein JNL69_12170, partial [Bacteroidia bacterium]|nr:hypothetical protein [Bacteroidia bacterium]
MKKLFILIISTATILTACKKEQNAEPEPKLPTVITQAISNITTNSAQSGGNIISEGSSGIIDKGVVWGTVPNPLYGAPGTYATNDGAGLGVYTSSIETDVTPGTTYYVKAYARNQIGYAYGEELSFTTLSLSAPTLTTGPITSITDNSAFCAGSITSDGGSAIITRGICWSTSPNPTISNSTTNDGSGIGTFVGYLTGNSNTLYYVRAYATNSSGTGYGNELSFTTKLGIGDSYQGGVIAYLLQPS